MPSFYQMRKDRQYTDRLQQGNKIYLEQTYLFTSLFLPYMYIAISFGISRIMSCPLAYHFACFTLSGSVTDPSLPHFVTSTQAQPPKSYLFTAPLRRMDRRQIQRKAPHQRKWRCQPEPCGVHHLMTAHRGVRRRAPHQQTWRY